LKKALLYEGLENTLLQLFRLKTNRVYSLGKGKLKLSAEIDFKDAAKLFPFWNCNFNPIPWRYRQSHTRSGSA
jgi:hypothetical protein